jgi:hypothetical protein
MVAVAQADHAEVLDVVLSQGVSYNYVPRVKPSFRGVYGLREAVYDKTMQELIRQVRTCSAPSVDCSSRLTRNQGSLQVPTSLLFDSGLPIRYEEKAIEEIFTGRCSRELD